MTPEQLRDSILQYAIQGKLVEHKIEDGNAKDILQKISEQKNILIKKGEAKKSKTLTPISDEEILFDIPENWQWTKLGEIASLITKGTTPRGGNVAYVDNGIGFLRAENVAGLDVIDKTNLKYISEETHNGYLKRSIIKANDILITIAGTLGRTSLVREKDLPLNANQAVSMVRLVDISYIDLKYIIYVLNSPEIQKYLTQQKKTTAIPNLTLEIIENCVCPLPPLEEQHHIVAKIEELLPFVDRYAEAYEKLEQFNVKFPEDMKKSILQYAIQGKLVEQRPEEGSAEDLYNQIQEEKQKLIKESKIKKDKPLAKITEDEIPFDIPDNWKWVRFGNLVTVQNGYAYKSEETNKNGIGLPVIKSGNLMSLNVQLKTRNDYVENPSEKMLSSKIVKGDMLMCLSSQSDNPEPLGKTAIYEWSTPALLNQRVLKIRTCVDSTTSYLYYTINSEYFHYTVSHQGGGSAQANLKMEHVLGMLIPLPPLEEQHRIVAKIEELLPYCD